MTELELKYGCNPNQSPPASLWRGRAAPEGTQRQAGVHQLHGRPELLAAGKALKGHRPARRRLPSSTSPRRGRPGLPLSDVERHIYFAPEGSCPPSPVPISGPGARTGCAPSATGPPCPTCDGDTARFWPPRCPDGIIAPGYTDEALEILRGKRKGATTW